jgi:hypothetical protein
METSQTHGFFPGGEVGGLSFRERSPISVTALFSPELGPFIPIDDVTPAALDTLKLFFPTVDTQGRELKPIPPNPLFPNPKLGVDGDLRGVAEFGVSSPSSSSTFEPPSFLPSLEFEGALLLGGFWREVMGDWTASGEIGWLVGFETTRPKGAFGVPEGDEADTTTVGVGGRSSALWLQSALAIK